VIVVANPMVPAIAQHSWCLVHYAEEEGREGKAVLVGRKDIGKWNKMMEAWRAKTLRVLHQEQGCAHAKARLCESSHDLQIPWDYVEPGTREVTESADQDWRECNPIDLYRSGVP
jgi:hypothetical protein